MKAKLYYVYDPMCSWCWGYAPTWNALQQKLTEFVDIHYCLGGLAEDSEQAMTLEMQNFLQQTWPAVLGHQCKCAREKFIGRKFTGH